MQRGSGARIWGLGLALIVLNLLVYAQVHDHPFINLDDAQYVVENRHVATGLTLENVTWAFSSSHAGNWHPVTWMSHMLDVELFGLDAGRHHLVNLFFHALNTLLLFGVLVRITGGVWQSGFVAAMFAVHPTHVESVAWIAERKDVLSGVFWVLTIWAYARYVSSPSVARYATVLTVFAAGLMAKPMLVTLPFVLLLLDFWPLRRTALAPVGRLVVEKLPLVACAMVSSIVTFLVQRNAGAVKSLETLSLGRRIASAMLGYAEYLVKTVWPTDLALLYPHPPAVTAWQVVVAAMLLLVTTALAIRAWKPAPFVTVGWLWFLGTLVPVIGFVQVGAQRIADRYLYLPSIGLFVVMAWGAPLLLRRWRVTPTAAAVAGVVAVSVSTMLAERQVEHWESSVAVWQHTITVTESNARAHNHLGHALAASGRRDEAIAEYEKALRLHPDYPETLNNLGAALAQRGELEAAIAAFRRAIELVPQLPHARANLAMALANAGRTLEALEQLTVLAHEVPDDAAVHRHRAAMLAVLGRYDEAIAEYHTALRLDPRDALAHNGLGAALGATGRVDEALPHYAEAVRLDPRSWEARGNLGRTLISVGRTAEGNQQLLDLTAALADEGRLAEAADHLEFVLRRDPNHSAARRLLVELAARSRRD